jgi:hypothetical protein
MSKRGSQKSRRQVIKPNHLNVTKKENKNEDRRENNPDNSKLIAPMGTPRPDKQSQAPHGPTKYEESHKVIQPKGREPWWFWHHDPIAKFTGWVAIFTSLLFFCAFIQAWAFIQSERGAAVMQIPDITITPTDRFQMPFRIANIGRGVIYIDDSNIITEITDKISRTDKRIPKKEGNSFPAVPPGAFISGLYTGGGTPIGIKAITPEQTDAINHDKFRLFVHGVVYYRDDFSIFGESIAPFCLVTLPARDREGKTVFGPCGDGYYKD